jgi:hypothetical protein
MNHLSDLPLITIKSLDLAIVRRSVERLATNQDQLARKQDQMAQTSIDRRALDVPRGADKPHRALIEAKMLTDYGRAQPHWPLSRLGKYVSQTFKHHVDFVARR